MVGNKTDLAHMRQVDRNTSEEFAKENEIPLYFEVSAKEDYWSIENLFKKIS